MVDVRKVMGEAVVRWIAIFLIALGVTGVLTSGSMWLVQTSAQQPDPQERLIRAEERQAAALEGIKSELQALRTDLRRAR
jgi:hypothetical protein